MKKNRPNPKADRLAENLRALIEAIAEGRLPSLRDLSVTLAVSPATVRKALKKLESGQVLELKPSARPRLLISRGGHKEEKGLHDRTERLYKELLEAIHGGIYAMDTPLPKLEFLARKHHMSENTVRKVYRKLIVQGLVFPQGKRFLVGKDRPPHPTVASVHSRPVVLIISNGANKWQLLCRNEWAKDFPAVFGREAQRSNTRLLQAMTKPVGSNPSVAAAGLEHTLALIANLGGNCRGCMIVSDRDSITDLAAWSHALDGVGKPVLWFDRNDSGRDGLSRKLIRCHYSEDRMTGAALEALVECGHRRIAFIHNAQVPWQVARLESLRRMAAILHPSLQVTGYENYHSPHFQNPLETGVLRLLEAIHPHCRGHVKDSFDHMIRNRESLMASFPRYLSPRIRRSRFAGFCAFAAMNPSQLPGVDPALLHHGGRLWGMMALWPALYRDKATAVVCPNDLAAVSHLMRHISHIGLRIPKEVSLLSFDNHFRDTFIPLTSVDSGFGSLGYEAFHILMGDLPMRHNRLPDIPVRPHVVDGGSVGPAIAFP